MALAERVALGLDFGTESVRALIVTLDGQERGSAVVRYKHGQITSTLPGTGEKLPADFALQDPGDWIDSAGRATRKALDNSGCSADDVIGVGVDFTSCTMLPAKADGTPLCQLEKFAGNKYAWPKLWKHHAAKRETDRINELARERNEPWLARYGGTIGLEWFFPKIFETLQAAPAVYQAADVWLEAGDWFVWQLVGGEADALPRSSCQAGYKAMWSAQQGYPSSEFFRALHPKLEHVVRDKMPGAMLSPGERAGTLTRAMAKRFGLREGTPVSAATIDAHAGVPGAGVAEPDILVMVMGTSSCHMLNSRQDKLVPGVAGVVEGGILPGMFGYETGQAAVGDAFDWLRRMVGHKNFDQLARDAESLPPGSDGVLCMDWMNGCRTPLMNGSLRGAFTGLTLAHGPGHLYRALLEASAMGVRWIADLLRESGVPVEKFVATGGLPHHNPLVVQVYADVLGESILVHPSKQGPALGAAILGVLAAGGDESGFKSPEQAIRAMAAPKKNSTKNSKTNQPGRQGQLVKPNRAAARQYNEVYARYRALADMLSA